MNNLYEIITENSSIAHNGEHLMTAVYEYYAGRSKELIKCEGYLNNIVNKVSNNYDFNLNKSPISRNDKDCVALEKELAKFFKVKEVRIYWEGGHTGAKSVMESKIGTVNRKKNLLDGTGNNMKIVMFISQNTISACDLTGAEVLSIILHEIGHNFYWSPLQIFNEIVMTVATIGFAPLISLFVRTAFIVTGEIKDWIRVNVPMLQNVADMYSRFKVEYKELIKPFNVIDIMSGPLISPFNLLNGGLSRYGEEKGADSFASKYGYGPELSSALRKCKNPKNTLYGSAVGATGKVGNVFGDITLIERDIVSMLLGNDHPNTNQRTASMLDKLEKDLSSGNYSPGAKKELEEEIKRMREAYDNVTLLSNNEDGPNIRKGIYTVVDDITNKHSDLREIFNFYNDEFRF